MRLQGDSPRWSKTFELGTGASGAAPAKWCVFSFVTQSRSLAIGQLSMQSYFKESFDLAGYGFSKDHYYHSWEFRSNVSDTWPLWSSILGHINAAPDNQ